MGGEPVFGRVLFVSVVHEFSFFVLSVVPPLGQRDSDTTTGFGELPKRRVSFPVSHATCFFARAASPPLRVFSISFLYWYVFFS